MIVKNERDVIERCLTSTLPLIDHWVIVDTGSTDGTQEIIRAFFEKKGIPGTLYERPWKNFSHNRNEAIELAKGKGDYLLFIDADEYLEFDPCFTLPVLNKDYYYITISHSGTHYARIQLINTKKEWAYVGVLHEVLVPKSEYTVETLPFVQTIYTTEGARSKDPLKYQKDAAILEEALKEEPGNSRYVFYLAQSYKNAGLYEKALENYKKRAEMGGWVEELFLSEFEAGQIMERLEYPEEKVVGQYAQAVRLRPTRCEPYYSMAKINLRRKRFEEAYQILKIAEGLPPSEDLLFKQSWMINWAIPLERSVAAYWTGRYEESAELSTELLKNPLLPNEYIGLVERNLGFAAEKLFQQKSNTNYQK